MDERGAGTLSGTWLMVHESSRCILLHEQVSVALWGLTRDEPYQETLPREVADPRVVDADADGDGEVSCEEVQGVGLLLNPGRAPEAANCSR